MLCICLFLICEIKDKPEAGLCNCFSRDCKAEHYTENVANTQTMSPCKYLIDWNLLRVLLDECLTFG